LNPLLRFAFAAFALAAAIVLFAPGVSAQTRDYFTDEEIEMVRDAQFIDKRIDVLIHCIDRRFAVLKLAGAPAVPEKEKDDWGPMPTGTHTQLLGDIKQILQKAIDDIDNLAERPDSAPLPLDPKEKPKKKPDLFPKAVRKLAAAAERYKPVLEKELEASKEKREQGILQDSIEMCDEIIASVAKLKS
jgi:hypothetical protein